MRIIKEKTLIDLVVSKKYSTATESLKAWIFEVRKADWGNSGQLKAKYRNASIIGNKRVVFNIKGNDFRLIADVEYELKLVFIVWFGTHEEYNKIDAKTIRYEK
jgi:mRNA interferase HigB